MKKLIAARIVFLVFYITCVIVLCYEAATPGPQSGSKSQAVGDFVADVVNGLSGDQSKTIFPTEVKINNTETNYFVGDKVQIQASTTPENATYTSLIYSSSDTSVANILPSGEVEFLQAGEATITVKNEFDQALTNSITFRIQNVMPSGLDISLNATKSDDIYNLYLGESYIISSTIKPANTTDKELNYSYDSNYLTIDEAGNICPINDSNNKVVTITITLAEITKKINCKVITPNIVEATNIDYELSKTAIYVNETLPVKVLYTPKNTTYQSFKITAISTNVSVVGNIIKGLAAGEAALTITDNRIGLTKDFSITILPQPICESFSLSKTSYNLNVGDSTTISLLHKLPNNCSTLNITYSVADTSVATVSSKGKIKALAEGNTTLYVRAYDGDTLLHEESATIEVKKREIIEKYSDEIAITSFELAFNSQYEKNYNKDKNEIFLTSGKYALKQLLNENDYIFSAIPKYKDYSFAIESTTSNITIDSNYLTIKGQGEATIIVTHLSTMLSASFNIYALPEMSANINVPVVDSKYTSEINKTYTIELTQEFIDDDIYYDFYTDSVDIKQIDATHYTFKSSNTEENYTICIYQMNKSYPGIALVEKKFEIANKYIYVQEINYHLEGLMENKELSVYEMNVGDSYTVFTTISPAKPSRYLLDFETNNSKIVGLNSSTIYALSQGEAIITITDTISGVNKAFKVIVKNVIALYDMNNPIKFEGTENSSINQNDVSHITITIKNKTSAKIALDLTKNSSYTNINYRIENSDIADIASDGTITAKKKGTTDVYLSLSDGNVTYSYKIELTVQPVEVIQKIESFYAFIRKSLGHYTAYLILGICATMFYMLMFRKKKYLIGVLVALASGFLLAILTEGIQYLTPGRYGCFEDIILDYYGYLTSGILIMAVYAIIWFVRFKKKKN